MFYKEGFEFQKGFEIKIIFFVASRYLILAQDPSCRTPKLVGPNSQRDTAQWIINNVVSVNSEWKKT